MTTWPDKPLIRIIRGREYEEPIDGSLAVREDPWGGYLLVSGPRAKNTVNPACTRTDSIDDWEEVTVVPSASLKRLRDEFRGAPISERRLAALLEVTSSLKRPAPSPLDQAVDRVENILEGPRTLLDTSSEEYLSQLLGLLSAFHEVENGPRPEAAPLLAMTVSLCVRWISEVSSPGSRYADKDGSMALAEARERAESGPALGGFPAMVALAGDAATWVDEAQNTEEGQRGPASGLVEPVLTIAHYALAGLAECLEDGEWGGRPSRSSAQPLLVRRRLRRRTACRDGREDRHECARPGPVGPLHQTRPEGGVRGRAAGDGPGIGERGGQ